MEWAPNRAHKLVRGLSVLGVCLVTSKDIPWAGIQNPRSQGGRDLVDSPRKGWPGHGNHLRWTGLSSLWYPSLALVGPSGQASGGAGQEGRGAWLNSAIP